MSKSEDGYPSHDEWLCDVEKQHSRMVQPAPDGLDGISRQDPDPLISVDPWTWLAREGMMGPSPRQIDRMPQSTHAFSMPSQSASRCGEPEGRRRRTIWRLERVNALGATEPRARQTSSSAVCTTKMGAPSTRAHFHTSPTLLSPLSMLLVSSLRASPRFPAASLKDANCCPPIRLMWPRESLPRVPT